MLQVPVMEPQHYFNSNFWTGRVTPYILSTAGGGYMVDWDLRTSLDGLYAAGGSMFGSGAHASAAVSGRYTGRKQPRHAKVVYDRRPQTGRSRKESGLFAVETEQARNILETIECRYHQDPSRPLRSI